MTVITSHQVYSGEGQADLHQHDCQDSGQHSNADHHTADIKVSLTCYFYCYNISPGNPAQGQADLHQNDCQDSDSTSTQTITLLTSKCHSYVTFTVITSHQVHPAQGQADLHQHDCQDSGQHSVAADHHTAHKHHLLAGGLGVDVRPAAAAAAAAGELH
jgi:hypothetical protein